MTKKNNGLTIVVGNGQWNAFGETTWRNKILYKVIEKRGGINEGVTDGTYIYSIRRQGLHLVESLLPAE
jgi:hypothetical protein